MSTPDLSEYRNQFILSKKQEITPHGWLIRQIGKWLLISHPSLPVLVLRNNRSESIGWLIGYPIDLEKGVLTSDITVDASYTESEKDIENWLYQLAGRYACIVVGVLSPRVYLDPTASLSVLYSSEEELVCSTCSVIGKGRNSSDWNSDLIDKVDTIKWYPFGLTPHRSLRRLSPNYYLDLSTFKRSRHWPSKDQIVVDEKTEDLIQTISEGIKCTVQALNNYGCYIALSGGNESRQILACSKNLIREVTFFTGTYDKRDFHIARKLAKKFQLNHVGIDLVKLASREMEKRLQICGFCSDKGSLYQGQQYKGKLEPDRLVLIGAGGEVGRGKRRKEADIESMTIDANELLVRHGFNVVPGLLREAEKWLNDLQGFNIFQIMDLSILEKFGCWGGPSRYFYDYLGYPEIYAFNHRQIYTAMLKLPYQYQYEQKMSRDVCLLNWPETLDIPINRYAGIRNLYETIKTTRGGSILNKLKSMFHIR